MFTRRRLRPRAREGTVMVLFAIMIVAILGTVAICLEVGQVQSTRARMQSAAESVALEVLRERDFATDTVEETLPAARDQARRQRNRPFASWTFANELAESYPIEEQGAGPYIELTPGDGDTNFGQLLAGVGHAVPTLQTNYTGEGTSSSALNDANGDIVSGSFTHATVGLDGNPIHLETSEGGTYSRVDFTPAAPAEAPFADSVMVRLRRTIAPGMPGNPDHDNVANISSSGWTFPLTFGMGAPFVGTDPNVGYSIRHHGLPLRATAIAEGRPAVRVGLSSPDIGDDWAVGTGTIALNEGRSNTGDGTIWDTDLDGNKYVILRLREFFALRLEGDDEYLFGVIQAHEPRRVGDQLAPLEWDPPSSGRWWDQDGYLPENWTIAEAYAPAFTRVFVPGLGIKHYLCGFFRISSGIHYDSFGEPIIDPETELPYIRVTRLQNTMTPGEPWIAPRNASAVFDGLQNPDLTDGIWAIVLNKLENTEDLVLAPALVR